MIRNFRLAMCVFVVLMLAGGTAVKAQQTLGGINGTVKDSSGGVISHATVKVRNVDTNLKQTTTTHENGEFSFVDLPIGTYEVTITNGGYWGVTFECRSSGFGRQAPDVGMSLATWCFRP